MKKMTAFVLVLALTAAMSGCAFVNVDLQRGRGPLQEQVVEGKGDKKILIVDITGTISDADRKEGLIGGTKPSVVAAVQETLRKAEEDRDLAGVILHIDSPGGTVTASDTIYHQIKRFKEKKRVPVTACITGFGTSGALYAASAADAITAHPTAITGSIGVIFLKFNVEGLLGKIGVTEQSVKSGRLKDMLSPFREATPEEKKLAQELIDGFARRFVDVVKEGRPKLSRAQVEALADGRVYTADQALAAGLIDRVSYLDEEIENMKKKLSLPNARVVRYTVQGDYRGSIYAGPSATADLSVLLLGVEQGAAEAGFMYLWKP